MPYLYGYVITKTQHYCNLLCIPPLSPSSTKFLLHYTLTLTLHHNISYISYNKTKTIHINNNKFRQYTQLSHRSETTSVTINLQSIRTHSAPSTRLTRDDQSKNSGLQHLNTNSFRTSRQFQPQRQKFTQMSLFPHLYTKFTHLFPKP